MYTCRERRGAKQGMPALQGLEYSIEKKCMPRGSATINFLV